MSRAVAIGKEKTTAPDAVSNGLPPPLPSSWLLCELLGADAVELIVLEVSDNSVVVELVKVVEVTVCLLLSVAEEVVDVSSCEDVAVDVSVGKTVAVVEDVAVDVLMTVATPDRALFGQTLSGPTPSRKNTTMLLDGTSPR